MGAHARSRTSSSVAEQRLKQDGRNRLLLRQRPLVPTIWPHSPSNLKIFIVLYCDVCFEGNDKCARAGNLGCCGWSNEYRGWSESNCVTRQLNRSLNFVKSQFHLRLRRRDKCWHEASRSSRCATAPDGLGAPHISWTPHFPSFWISDLVRR